MATNKNHAASQTAIRNIGGEQKGILATGQIGSQVRKLRPATRNFCIRLTDHEKRLLLERAGRVPLGAFIRNIILDDSQRTKRRHVANPRRDDTALARVLASLGQSRLSSNLNQLAKAVNIGALPVTLETEQEIISACVAVASIRKDLLIALGLTGNERP